ncbi:hypothetical protein D9758_005019 [Tetrapyrgos nigripes]|uniref:Uncharacterized protein n=1 Tax=Tetrapyrgos nigripes TaxID=182062 RepID=A0A8H5GVR0_9AGAR|nr:hypothetical protein D9758_005019 [Tetrapyrgos nigripes]
MPVSGHDPEIIICLRPLTSNSSIADVISVDTGVMLLSYFFFTQVEYQPSASNRTPRFSDSSDFQTRSGNLQASHDLAVSPPKCHIRKAVQEMNTSTTPSTITPFNVTTLAAMSNPYLALLPPDMARAAQATVYVQVGTLGMFLWDILMNLHGDYQIIAGHAPRHTSSLAGRKPNKMIFRVGLPTVVYFISRIMTLGFQLSSTLLMVAPVSCTPTARIIGATSYLSIISTALLFFFRVRAVYHNHPYIRAVFFSLWIITVGLASVDILFINVGTLSLPRMQTQCVLLNVKKIFALIPGLAVLLYDTSVFLAISYKLYRNSHLEESSSNVRGLGSRTEAFFFPGKKLPAFSRALLKDGQVYYLISFLCSAALVAFLLAPNVSDYYRLFLVPVHLAVINSMACHVFRNVKLGRIQNRQVDELLDSSMQFHASSVVTPIASGMHMVPASRWESPSPSTIGSQTETETRTESPALGTGRNSPAEWKRDWNTL